MFGAGIDTMYALPYGRAMKAISATEARKRLYKLLDEVAVTSEPGQGTTFTLTLPMNE